MTFSHRFVCLSLKSLCHSNGHIEIMPAREINPFTALSRIRSQFLRTQWSTTNRQRVDMTTPQIAQPSGMATFSHRVYIDPAIINSVKFGEISNVKGILCEKTRFGPYLWINFIFGMSDSNTIHFWLIFHDLWDRTTQYIGENFDGFSLRLLSCSGLPCEW